MEQSNVPRKGPTLNVKTRAATWQQDWQSHWDTLRAQTQLALYMLEQSTPGFAPTTWF